MAPKAAVGSSKNMTPELADGEVERLAAEALGLHVDHDEARRCRRRPALARSRASSSSGAEMSNPTTCPSGPTALGQGDGQRATAAADVADPLAGLRGRPPRAGRASGPRSAAPARATAATHRSSFQRFGFLLVGHGANVTVPQLGSAPCASASSSCPSDRWRRGPAPVGVGRPRRVPHGLDLRPHPLGRHARRALARRGARAGRRGRRHRAGPSRHARRDAELPPSRHAGPRRPRARRPEQRPPRPRARARAARDPTPRRSARSRGHAAERLARFEEFLAGARSRSSTASPPTRTSLDDGALHRGRGAQHAGSACSSPLPLTIAAGGPKGLRLAAAATAATGSPIGPTGRGRAHARDDASRRSRASSPSSTRRAARRAGTRRASAGCCCGRRPSRSSTSLDQFDELVAPLRRTRLRPVRAAPPRPDGAVSGRRRRRSSGSPSAPPSPARLSRASAGANAARHRRASSSAAPGRRRLHSLDRTRVQPTHDAASGERPRHRRRRVGTQQRHLLGHQHLVAPARVDQAHDAGARRAPAWRSSRRCASPSACRPRAGAAGRRGARRGPGTR